MSVIERLCILIAEADLEAPFAALVSPVASATRRAALVALALLPTAVEASRACPGAFLGRLVMAVPPLWPGLVHWCLRMDVGIAVLVSWSRIGRGEKSAG